VFRELPSQLGKEGLSSLPPPVFVKVFTQHARTFGIFKLVLRLKKDSLTLATFPVVATEAGATSRGKVARSTSRANTAFLVSWSAQWVSLGRALTKGAVWTLEARVTFAAYRASGIPRIVVGRPGVRSSDAVGAIFRRVRDGELTRDNSIVGVVGIIIRQLLLGFTDTVTIAVIGAYTALACSAGVAGGARARARFAVAGTTVGAFNEVGSTDVVVHGCGGSGPSTSAGAGTEGAVSTRPGSDRGGTTVQMSEALATIFDRTCGCGSSLAGSVTGAAVGAVCADNAQSGDQGK